MNVHSTGFLSKSENLNHKFYSSDSLSDEYLFQPHKGVTGLGDGEHGSVSFLPFSEDELFHSICNSLMMNLLNDRWWNLNLFQLPNHKLCKNFLIFHF